MTVPAQITPAPDDAAQAAGLPPRLVARLYAGELADDLARLLLVRLNANVRRMRAYREWREAQPMPCANAACRTAQPGRRVRGRCVACYLYWRRTGADAPLGVVARRERTA